MKGKHTMLLSCAALGAGAMYLLHPGVRPGRNQSRHLRRLVQRVRDELNRAVSHPYAIDIHVAPDGMVTLAGPVLMDEADHAISRIQAIIGAAVVDDRLERYADRQRVAAAENVTAGPRRGVRRSAKAEPYGHRTH